MSHLILINQFAGTPLEALANNANVYGGNSLSPFEFSIMQKQMKNLGLTFEEFGLEVISSDLEGENSKETRNNTAETGSDYQKAYKKQFGSKNDVVTAQTAELKADSIVKTALDMFKSEHPDVYFIPKNLGSRPNFTQPQYKNKSGLYAMDLTEWANTVKMEYINATKLSNEALAAMIIDNNNEQTALLSAEMLALANDILAEVEAGTAEIIDTVQLSTKQIVKTIRSAEGHIVKVVQDNTGKIINVVKEEGVKVRNTVREVGSEIINDNREQHAVTNNILVNSGKHTRNVIRGEAYRQRQLTKQTAKETQELEAMNIAIAERLDVLHLATTLPVRVGNMQNQIAKARIPHHKKMELLQRIRNQLSELYTSDRELDKLQEIIDKTIDKYKGRLNISDIPPLPEPPSMYNKPPRHFPDYEKFETNENDCGRTTDEPLPKNKIKEPYVTDECGFKTEKEVVEKVNKSLKK